jgi:hypothetical protein
METLHTTIALNHGLLNVNDLISKCFIQEKFTLQALESVHGLMMVYGLNRYKFYTIHMQQSAH